MVKDKADDISVPCCLEYGIMDTLLVRAVVPEREVAVTVRGLGWLLYLLAKKTPPTIESKKTMECLAYVK